MAEKPRTAAGYAPEQVARVKSKCLYLATKLGDLMPELVVVGGLVPSLLIDQKNLTENVAPHVGTMDLDLGLAFALVGEQRYQEVAERMRNAKFSPDENEDGKPTRQRWRISDPPVTVDFLIEPENTEAKPGSVFSLTKDWAATIAPGLHLAFKNNQTVTLSGQTIVGETTERDIRLCGAGAFVVLKALAFHIRGENKDAYDLFYLLRNFGRGVSDVAAQLRPLLPDASAVTALEYLRTDFKDSETIGPSRVAEFLYGRPDANIQADAVGFVRQLLNEIVSGGGK
jgi:predicted nucleotidyltransferase